MAEEPRTVKKKVIKACPNYNREFKREGSFGDNSLEIEKNSIKSSSDRRGELSVARKKRVGGKAEERKNRGTVHLKASLRQKPPKVMETQEVKKKEERKSQKKMEREDWDQEVIQGMGRLRT